MPIAFLAHLRTVNRLQQYGLLGTLKNHVILTKPLGYFQFLGLLKNSITVLTDSGGVQEEACILGVPTVTLRYNTERPETVVAGTNVIAGVEADKVAAIALDMVKRRDEITRKRGCGNLIGDGSAGGKIAKIIKEFKDKVTVESSDTREDPYVLHAIVESVPQSNEINVIAMYDDNGLPTLELNKAKGLLIRASLSRLREWLRSK